MLAATTTESTEGELALTDLDFEDSNTLRALLRLVSRGEVPVMYYTDVDSIIDEGTWTSNLAAFLIKYECIALSVLIRNTLLLRARCSALQAVLAFVVGSQYGDINYCSDALDILWASKDIWERNCSGDLDHGIPGWPMNDLRALPRAWARRVPLDYLMVALRADTRCAGDNFRDLMTDISR